jgi:hypothetical protein
MAAKFRPDNGITPSNKNNDNVGLKYPFTGSPANAALAAQIGRHLQSWYQASLKQPLPDELADRLRRLRERQGRWGKPEMAEMLRPHDRSPNIR